jgi:hypothetical protein
MKTLCNEIYTFYLEISMKFRKALFVYIVNTKFMQIHKSARA